MTEDIKKVQGHISQYDKKRKTTGAIYRDLQMTGDKSPALVGDMSNEMAKDLVTDINEALLSDPFHGKPFYLTIHEKKDLQAPKQFFRRLIKTLYRPWPEDDTVVFWKNPKTQDLRFCWCLPHWSEMENMLANSEQFSPEMIADIKAWKKFDLSHFGFYQSKNGNGDKNWWPDPNWKDKPVEEYGKEKFKRIDA